MSLLPVLLDRFCDEEGVDEENRSWAASAYFGLVPREESRTLIKALDQAFYQTPLELVVQLFTVGEPLDRASTLNLKAFERDRLSHKWLCILCGYAVKESRTISKRLSDIELLRNLVFDDDPEVIEYSIWALHRHPRGDATKLMCPTHKLMGSPNIRRWLYRLVTKTEKSAKTNAEMIVAAMDPLREPSIQAREGLALGLAALRLPTLRVETAEWFGAEAEISVKFALVDHLAARAGTDILARDALVAEYARLDPQLLLARKIESALGPALLKPVKDSRTRLGGVFSDQFMLDLDFTSSMWELQSKMSRKEQQNF